jgi:hypothetical protein
LSIIQIGDSYYRKPHSSRNLPLRVVKMRLAEVTRDFDARRHRAIQLLMEIGLETNLAGNSPTSCDRET